MPEKGYMIKNGDVIITSPESLEIFAARNIALDEAGLQYSLNRVVEIVLPESLNIDEKEYTDVYNEIFSRLCKTTKGYDDKIKDFVKEAEEKIHEYF